MPAALPADPVLPQPLPPELRLVGHDLLSAGASVVAVGFTRAGEEYVVASAGVETLDRLELDPFALLDRAKAKGTAGETVSHERFGDDGPRSVVLVGLGSHTSRDMIRAGAAVARIARRTTSSPAVATTIAAESDEGPLAAFVEGLVLGSFGFHRRSDELASEAPVVVLSDINRRSHKRVQSLVDRAAARAMASWRARSYALTPSNEKGPVQLGQWAREAADRARLGLDIWDEKRLTADGFGGILAVGRGSAYDSRFLRLDYTPRRSGRQTRRVVLVGKGITFDSGGISIKPRDAMMTMKRDMTGAGVVIAVMGALRELDVPVSVTGLVASAENAFGAASMRPGDVVTHYGGRTSEVGNTDAEGRLVLADALAYADAHLRADVVVDIATLTGAAKVALGTSLGALFANDDDLATRLYDAGQTAGEPVWRLPLADDYEPLLDNPFADATNAAGGPGSITAALFLQHFVGVSTPWAHLDIASVGDSPKDAFEYTQGATGFGARLLLHWLAAEASR